MASNYSISVDVLLNTNNIQPQINKLKDVSSAGKNIGLTYQEANLIMSKSIEIISAMVEQVYELDGAITEFKKVSDLSGKALDTYVDKLSKLGSQVGKTKSEMVEAATEFKKSGFSEADSAQLALTASYYQNIADEELSAGEAANFIISQIKAFNLTANDSMHIIDAINEVSNTSAVSSADLATNIGKASAALSVGNNTYEETLGLMTGIVEITRQGSRAARGLVK